MPGRYQPTPLRGVVLIEPQVYTDARGCFFESYNQREAEAAGIPAYFVQDNQSLSRKGVLRGMHYQHTRPQAKLVRVIRGAVYDVAADLRPHSPTYGQWFGITLSGENRLQLYIPEGFAHGFYTLSEEAEFCYKCSAFYDPALEAGVRFDDPALGIEWPLEGVPLLSPRDLALPCLKGGAQ